MNEGNAFDDEKEWKIYWKGFDDRDKEGIIVSVFVKISSFFLCSRFRISQENERESVRKYIGLTRGRMRRGRYIARLLQLF